MSVKNRKVQQKPQRVKLRPHGEFADKIIRLAQGQLSDTERIEVEDHLDGCPACADAYRLYRGVSCVVRNVSPPPIPAGLPANLQQLKQELARQDKEHAATHEPPAVLPQTLQEVTNDPPQQHEPESIQADKAFVAWPSEGASTENNSHPAVEEARRILHSAKGSSPSKKGSKMGRRASAIKQHRQP